MESPTSIGRYQVECLLGEGGMGAVYLAKDPTIGRRVAIKVLRTDDDEYRKRFKLEVNAVGALRHRHIITIFDSGEHQGSPFLAMEYVPGETLAQKIARREDLTLTERLRFIIEICDGLAHAHRAGIVHRDVKPANVIVDDEDQSIKVVDFGIARVTSVTTTMTRSGVMVGTLSYMAPEQITGKVIDRRCDVFAVGCVLYELLSYQRAFPGGIQDGLMYRIVHEPPAPLGELLPDLDRDVIDVAERALRKAPEERYSEIKEMSAALGRVRQRLLAREAEATDKRPLPAIAVPQPLRPLGHPVPAPVDDVPPRPAVPAPSIEASATKAPVIEAPAESGPSINAAPSVETATGQLARVLPWPVAAGIAAVGLMVGVLMWLLGQVDTTSPPQAGSAPTQTAAPAVSRQAVNAPSAAKPSPTPPKPAAVAKPESKLRVSVPPDAEVTLNGFALAGEATVDPGSHTVRVRRVGVIGSIVERVEISEGLSRTIAPDLSTSSLLSGALPFPFVSVTVEGQAITTRVPAFAGSYEAVFVPAAGSALPRRVATFALQRGAEVDLSRQIPRSRLRFEVTPAADVTIDTRAFGTVTGGLLADAAVGEYPIRIRRRGYPDFTDKVSVRAGGEQVVRFAYNFASGAWVRR